MNKLLEQIIQDRFHVTTVKMEHLRSSAHYEVALYMTVEMQWDALEALLIKLQIIRTAATRRAADQRSTS